MAEDEGWIKLHRKFTDSDIFQHPGMWHLFCYCMAKAHFRDKEIVVPGTFEKRIVKRGSLITGRNALHERLYPHKTQFSPSPSTLWRWLEQLEVMESVKLENLNNRCTMVTVCQYERYNAHNLAVEQAMNKPCASNEQAIGTIEELNKHTTHSKGLNWESLSSAITGIEIDGELVTYDQDSLRWEAELIRQWNGLQNVTQHRQMALDLFERRLLMERLQDPGWFWKQAMAKFPLWSESGWMPDLSWFLEFGSVTKINGNRYSQKTPREVRSKGKKHDRKGPDNSGSAYVPGWKPDPNDAWKDA